MSNKPFSAGPGTGAIPDDLIDLIPEEPVEPARNSPAAAVPPRGKETESILVLGAEEPESDEGAAVFDQVTIPSLIPLALIEGTDNNDFLGEETVFGDASLDGGADDVLYGYGGNLDVISGDAAGFGSALAIDGGDDTVYGGLGIGVLAGDALSILGDASVDGGGR